MSKELDIHGLPESHRRYGSVLQLTTQCSNAHSLAQLLIETGPLDMTLSEGSVCGEKSGSG